MPTLSAHAIKIVVVLDPHEVADTLRHVALDARVPITIEVDGRKLRTDFSAKSVRKALATLQHAGPENVAVIVQGKLMRDDTIAEAGLVAQVKAPKPEPAAEATRRWAK
jgi:hypothetical protein